MWLCRYDGSLSTINNDHDHGSAVDGEMAATKEELIRKIKNSTMDSYLRSPHLEPNPEAGIKYCMKVRCVDGNIYWYNLIDFDDLEGMDKGFYQYEYEEYVAIRDRHKEDC